MRLTVFSDYTLRVLLYLGLQPDRRATIAEIAEAYGISKNHLMKVVHHLAMCGHVETVRGKGGGLHLRADPATLSIGSVVRATEEDSALVECFEAGPPHCRIISACALKGILQEALEGFFAVLDRYTLADLLANRPRLERLLFASSVPAAVPSKGASRETPNRKP